MDLNYGGDRGTSQTLLKFFGVHRHILQAAGGGSATCRPDSASRDKSIKNGSRTEQQAYQFKHLSW